MRIICKKRSLSFGTRKHDIIKSPTDVSTVSCGRLPKERRRAKRLEAQLSDNDQIVIGSMTTHDWLSVITGFLPIPAPIQHLQCFEVVTPFKIMMFIVHIDFPSNFIIISGPFFWEDKCLTRQKSSKIRKGGKGPAKGAAAPAAPAEW